MPETLREKIEKLPVSRISIQADDSFTDFFDFLRRDDVLTAVDSYFPTEMPSPERLAEARERLGKRIAEYRANASEDVRCGSFEDWWKSLDNAQEWEDMGDEHFARFVWQAARSGNQEPLSVAKEQTRALIAISQTLGSIHEELKHMNHG